MSGIARKPPRRGPWGQRRMKSAIRRLDALNLVPYTHLANGYYPAGKDQLAGGHLQPTSGQNPRDGWHEGDASRALFLRWLRKRGAWAGPADRADPADAPAAPPAVPDEPGPEPERLPGVYHDWHRPLPSHDRDAADEDEGCRGV